MIDSFRYIIALLTILIVCWILVFWFLVHVFAPMWRGIGHRATYIITLAIATAAGFLAFQYRSALLGTDLGTNWLLITLSIILFGFMAWFERTYWHNVSWKVLVGLPEISPANQSKRTVMRHGLYGVMRHPRYFSGALGLAAGVLLANYSGTYLLALLLVPMGYLLIRVEERELVARFGDDYRNYQREVPRFIPRRWKNERNKT